MSNPIHVLDLDLDLFLDNPSSGRNGPREPDKDYNVWDEANVVAFLERQCGLSRDRRILGRFVRDHFEAFWFFRHIVENLKIGAPLDIVHADAHSDLGMGVGGREYLTEDILHRNVTDRRDPRVDADQGANAMNVGNYLLFAIANQWVANLTWVALGKLLDLWPLYFRDYDVNSGAIQLAAYAPGHIDAIYKRYISPTAKQFLSAAQPVKVEPPVPFSRVEHQHFSNREPFEFILLCHSPPYTPKKADFLIPIIQRYFDPM